MEQCFLPCRLCSKAALLLTSLAIRLRSIARPHFRSCTATSQSSSTRHCSPSKRQCGLTPRSSGAPTAGHQARSGGTRYIFASPGLASRRRRPLSSNVRPRIHEYGGRRSFEAALGQRLGAVSRGTERKKKCDERSVALTSFGVRGDGRWCANSRDNEGNYLHLGGASAETQLSPNEQAGFSSSACSRRVPRRGGYATPKASRVRLALLASSCSPGKNE